MKRNTILTSAVALALTCAGSVAAQDSAQECAAKAAQLKTQIESSELADSDRAKLEDSLSEAATADVARCDQIVSRVERELGVTKDVETSGGSADDDYSSVNEGAESSSSTAGTTVNSGYEEGHAAASASMPDHPGAAANQTDPASTTMKNEGYASPEATTAANEDEPATTESETSSDDGTTTSSATSDYDTITSSETGTTSATSSTVTTTSAETNAGESLAGMTADDLVNKRVQTADGKDVGEIDAVVTDKMSQEHGYAVVGVGGVLGVGEKQVLVDLDQLQLTADGDIQVQASDATDFDSLPRYDEDHFEKYEGDIGRLL